MENEDRKDKKTKNKRPDLGFCDPEHFNNFDEMRKNCCQTKNDCADYSKMMSGMMKSMKHMCCVFGTEKSEK